MLYKQSKAKNESVFMALHQFVRKERQKREKKDMNKKKNFNKIYQMSLMAISG